MLISLSLLAFYEHDNTLFDNLTLPEGIDKEIVVSHILNSAGDFEPTYTEYDFLKYEIGMWGKRHYFTFDRWIKALSKEYDPLSNYDRYEFSSDNFNENENTGSEQGITSNSGDSSDSVQSTDVSAFDSSNYSPKEKVTTGSNSETTLNQNSTESFERIKNNSNQHSAHLYGNIGVTTSQQMLELELEVSRFNIYDEIVNLFKREMLVTVW